MLSRKNKGRFFLLDVNYLDYMKKVLIYITMSGSYNFEINSLW